VAAFEEVDDLLGGPAGFEEGEEATEVLAFEQRFDRGYEFVGLDGLWAHRLMLGVPNTAIPHKGAGKSSLERSLRDMTRVARAQ
jgi:hypothetical protein